MKKQYFFENAKLINNKFRIVPLLYGSLGLEYITNENLKADDIDILIQEVFLKERWNEFKKFLIDEGYELFDEHEHTFQKNNILYSYASIEELKSFVDIDSLNIEHRYENGVEFMILSLEQYLKVYQKSLMDGYRIEVRKKNDRSKIEFIKNHINKNNHK